MLRRRLLATAAASALIVGVIGGYARPAVAAPVLAADTLRSGAGFAFGNNDKGQTEPGSSALRTFGARQLPAGTSGLLTDAVSIAAGKGFAVWVNHRGEVWGIGDNAYGDAGNGSTGGVNRTPVKAACFGAAGQPKAVKVSAFGLAVTVLDSNGAVWQWGQVVSSKGNYTIQSSPSKLTFPSGTGRIIDISSGEAFSLALDVAGKAYAWGKNDRGQLGLGTNNTSPAPARVTGLPLLAAGSLAHLEAGRDFGAYTVSGPAGVAIYTWGRGDSYQLGAGSSTADSKSPKLLTATVAAPAKVLALSAGGAHTLLLTNDGGLRTWGNNGLASYQVPTLVPDPAGALSGAHHPYTVAAGDGASFAASTDGTVAAWGVDSTGQLGQATAGSLTAPTLITVPGTAPATDAGVPALITSRQGATYVVVDSEITRGPVSGGYDFGAFPTHPAAGQTPPSKAIALTNVATKALAITSVVMDGAHPGDFTITANTCTGILALDATCTITVRFAPTVTGARQAGVVLRTSNTIGGVPLQTIVPLSGRGYAQVPGLADLTLDLASGQPTTVSGPGNVIPLDALSPSLIPTSLPATASAPLGKLPLGKLPLGKLPLGKLPLGKLPLGKLPLGKLPLGKLPLGKLPLGKLPLGKLPLGKLPLGKLPLLRQGGWPEALQPYPNLRDIPISALTLVDLMDPTKNQPDPTITTALPLERIALSDLAVSTSTVASVSAMSVLAGSLRLDQFSGVDWAHDLPLLRNGGTASDGAGLHRVLLELDLQGVSLDETRVGAVTVGQLVTDELSATSDPLDEAIFPAILLRSVTLPGTHVGGIALSALPDISLVLDCAQADCVNLAGRTLGDVTVDELRADASFRELGVALHPITMAQLVEPFLDRSSFDWESLPVSAIPLAAYPNKVTLAADVDVNCRQAPGLSLAFAVPTGFRSLPGTTKLARTRGSGDVSLPDPTPDPTRGLVVPIADSSFAGTGPIACVDDRAHVRVTTQLLPTPAAGSYRATVDARATSVPPLTAAQGTALTVTGLNEPPDETPDGPLGAADQLILGSVKAPGQPAYVPFLADPEKVIEVTISSKLDIDGILYFPKGALLDEALSPLTTATRVPFGEAAAREADELHPLETAYGGALQDIVQLTDRPVAAIGATRGLDVEQLSAVARAGDDNRHVLAVVGYNRAVGDFTVRIRLLDPPALASCSAVPPALGAAAASPFYGSTGFAPGDNTVVLVNTARLAGRAGQAEVSRVLQAADSYVHGGAGGVQGQVMQVDAFPAVLEAAAAADASPCDKAKNNAEVRAITGVLASAPDTIRYVVLAGGHDLIRHACLRDTTRDGNEREEAGSLALTGGNPIASCFAGGGYLSDAPYGTRQAQVVAGQVIYLPQAAPARLVESAAEIAQQLEDFVTNDGVADPRTQSSQPRTAVVTDYDFLTSGGNQTAAALAAEGYQVDHGLTGQDATWTKAQLDAAWLGKATVPAVAALNMHYDQYRGLPAFGDATGDQSELYTSAQVSAGPSLAKRVVFTVGCHSGLDVPDSYGDAATAARARDFAQAYAGKGVAFMLGNLGFGYADTTTVAYSALHQSLFAANLERGYDVGTAHAEANRQYLNRLAGLSAYDLKSLQQTVGWGLPQYRLTSAPAVVPSGPPVLGGPPMSDPRTGLRTTSLSVGTAAAPLALTTVDDGDTSHLTATGADGVPRTVSVPGRPILPAQFLDVPQLSGQVVRSVVPTSFTSQVQGSVLPTFARASVDRGQAPEPQSAGVFPSTLGHVGTSLSAGGGSNTLTVTPAQLIARGAGAFDLRTFPTSKWQVSYGPAGDSLPDTITHVSSTRVPAMGGNPAATTYSVQVEAAAGATTKRVYVLSLPESGNGASVLTELAEDNEIPGHFTGGALGRLGEFLVVALNSRGDAALSNLKGGGWLPEDLTGPIPADELSHLHVSAPGPNGWYTADPALTVDAPYTAIVDGKAVGSPHTVAGDGVHLVQLRRADGSLVPGGLPLYVDTVVPEVVVTVAPASRFELNEDVPFTTDVLYGASGQGSLVDTGRPLGGGRALVTSVVGAKTLTVTATSVAGLAGSAGKAYQVVYGSGSTGFLSPVASAPGLNVVTRGLVYAFSYHLVDHHGADVTTGAGTGNVAAFAALSCPDAPYTVQLPRISGATSQPVHTGNGVWSWELAMPNEASVAVCKHLTVTTNDTVTGFAADLRILP